MSIDSQFLPPSAERCADSTTGNRRRKTTLSFALHLGREEQTKPCPPYIVRVYCKDKQLQVLLLFLTLLNSGMHYHLM